MKIILALLLIVSLSSYFKKKSFTCICTNPGGSYPVWTIQATRSDANAQCQDYYEQNFGHIPMNETYCQIR